MKLEQKAEHILILLGAQITDTKIEYIANQLEIAYTQGQLDVTRELRKMGEQA